MEHLAIGIVVHIVNLIRHVKHTLLLSQVTKINLLVACSSYTVGGEFVCRTLSQRYN